MESLPDFISNLPVGLQYTLAVLVALATIGFPISVIMRWITRWPMLRLWPHREGWSADCNKNPPKHLDPNNAWRGGRATSWSQMREQKVNDYFYLHIKKPRVISRIRLCTEGIRCPKRYSLEIRESDDKDWMTLGQYESLDVTLENPRRIAAIKWSIAEPRSEPWEDGAASGDSISYPAWAIYDIELTEVRLFGRWWQRVIEERT